LLYSTLVLTVLLSGCGRKAHEETEAEALAKYGQQASALREALRQVASLLPARVNPKERPPLAKLDPPMCLAFGDSQNAHVVSEPQLTNLEAPPELAAWWSDNLIMFLQWMDSLARRPSANLHGSPEYSDARSENFLATKYLVVIRTVEFTPPKAVNPDDLKAGYTRGEAALDAFVVNLASSQVLAAFRVSAVTDKEISFEHSKSDSASDTVKGMEDEARDSLLKNVRVNVEKVLEDQLGAQVTK